MANVIDVGAAVVSENERLHYELAEQKRAAAAAGACSVCVKPTCRELLDNVSHYNTCSDDDVDALAARVERVLALHKPRIEIQMVGTGMTRPSCIACFPAPWPCPTVRALDGEEP